MKFLAPLDNKLHNIKTSNRLSSNVKKALHTDVDAPQDKHIAAILDSSGDAQALSRLITSVPLIYQPPVTAMQSLSDASSPWENSIYTKSSGAYKKMTFEGLQVVKALYLLHRLLEQCHQHVTVFEPHYRQWMAGLALEMATSARHTGYRDLAAKYSTYLQMRLKTFAQQAEDSQRDLCVCSWIDVEERERLSMALLDLRNDLQMRLVKGDEQRVVKLSLKTVIADMDMI